MRRFAVELRLKANIDDFPKSPACFVAANSAWKDSERLCILEPEATVLPKEFDGTGAQLIDIDTALEECGILIALVDHDVFKAIPPEERAAEAIYDTRGFWS